MITDDPEVEKIGFDECKDGVIRGENFTILHNELNPDKYDYMVKGLETTDDIQMAILNTITGLSKWKDSLNRDIKKLKKLLIVEHQKAHKKS